jgi:DNA-binding response OmpR family regulator
MNKKILIVEDDLQLQGVLRDRLSHEGFDVLEAGNGKDGLGLALSSHPDLILLDLIMPVMDGLTMANQLRLDDWGRDVPVIILTNLSDNEKISEALKNGVFDFLVKSDWKLEDLVAKVKEKVAV